MIQNEKPRVIVKNKTLSFIFDYCIESKTPFSVNPRLSGDEWEIEFKITDIMGAVALGMFLRENRIEPVGLQVAKPQAVVASVAKAKVTKTKKQDTAEIAETVFTAPADEAAPVQPHETFAPVAEEEEEDTFEAATEEEASAVEADGFSPEMLFDEN